MYRLVILMVMLLSTVMTTTMFAQSSEADSSAKTKKDGTPRMGKWERARIKFGIFAEGSAGITFGFFNKLEKELKGTLGDSSGGEFSLRKLGSNFSGKLALMIGSRIQVRGGINYFGYDASETEKGQSSLRGLYYGGDVGVVVFHRKRFALDKEIDEYEYKYSMMLYPFIGFMTGTSTLKLSNYSKDKFYIGDDNNPNQQVIDRSDFADFTAKLNMLEIGFGSKFALNEKGICTVGAELGGYFNVGKSNWKTGNGVAVPQIQSANVAGVYLRATLGLGYMAPKSGEAKSKKKKDDGFVEPEKVGESNSGSSNNGTATESTNSGTDSSTSTTEEKPKKEKKAKKTKE